MINLDDARLGPMHGLVGIAEGRTKSALARGGTTARRKPTRRTRLTSTTFEEKSVPQEAVCDVDAFALHVVATVLQAAVAQLTCGSTQEESKCLFILAG